MSDLTALTPYSITPARFRECEWCSEGADVERVHSHSLYVSRDGASTRSADDLCHVFMCDVLDILRALGRDDDDAEFWKLHAIAEEFGAKLEARRDRTSGVAWLEESDGEISDALGDFESVLSDLGLSVEWCEGYVIEALTLATRCERHDADYERDDTTDDIVEIPAPCRESVEHSDSLPACFAGAEWWLYAIRGES